MANDHVQSRTLTIEPPYDLYKSLRLHRMGPGDPTTELATDHLWRAAHLSGGPATIHVRRLTPTTIEATTWGPGGPELLEQAHELLGLHRPAAQPPSSGPLRKLHRRSPGLRLPRMPDPLRTLTQTILQQRVHWKDASRSFRQLVLRYGTRAPGPQEGLYLLPPPARMAEIPLHEYVTLGIERQRAQIIRTTARAHRRVQELRDLPLDEAKSRLQAFDGVGPWTTEMTLGFALGHEDALPLGDFDLPHLVTWAFTGNLHGDDRQMQALLEPFRPHRWRVIRLLMESGWKRPKTGIPRKRSPMPHRFRARRYP